MGWVGIGNPMLYPLELRARAKTSQQLPIIRVSA
jgi:hypothetical protein